MYLARFYKLVQLRRLKNGHPCPKFKIGKFIKRSCTVKEYSRVSYEQRCQIFSLLQVKVSVPKIASLIGVNKSTVYRELKRNSSKNEYRPIAAQRRANHRKKRCRKRVLIDQQMEQLILDKIHLFWSPEQIAGRLKKEGKDVVSVESIYRYIRKNKHLKQFMRFMHKGGAGRQKQRQNSRNTRKSIHHRPEIINKRKRVGDWERDGMYGANRRQILVCTERKTRYTKLAIIKDGRSHEINELTLQILKETKKPVLSITNDNGSEFRRPLKNEIPVYYCDPMKPQQRGTVENTIGTLRKQIKRTTDLNEVGDKGIKSLEVLFNLVPRKGLDFKTPYEVFFNKEVALAN